MKTVVLDPGHGGKDSGASFHGILEKELTLTLAKMVRDELQNFPVNVILTRETDTYVELSRRADIANRAKADYFLSLHINAGGGEGFESYVFPGTEGGETGRMQTVVHETVMEYLSAFGVKDRGKKSADFAVLRGTRMPALLTENLFLDNEHDRSLLLDRNFLAGLARATARGIAQGMNLPHVPSANVPGNPSNQQGRGEAKRKPPHWAQGEIERLKARGMIRQDHDPQEVVTFGMLATIINRLFDRIER
ncbi:hypothetical protein BSNK01_31410 [Bacillaceae bacterium]